MLKTIYQVTCDLCGKMHEDSKPIHDKFPTFSLPVLVQRDDGELVIESRSIQLCDKCREIYINNLPIQCAWNGRYRWSETIELEETVARDDNLFL